MEGKFIVINIIQIMDDSRGIEYIVKIKITKYMEKVM